MKQFFLFLLVFSTLSLSAQQVSWSLHDYVTNGGTISTTAKDEFLINGGSVVDPLTGKQAERVFKPKFENRVPGNREVYKNSKRVNKKTEWTTLVGMPFVGPNSLYQFYEENYSIAITSDAKILTSKPHFRKTNFWGRKADNNGQYCYKLTGLQLKDVRTNTVIKDITTDVIADWETKGEYEFHLNYDETRLLHVNKKSGDCQLAIYNLETGTHQSFPLGYSIIKMQQSKDLLMFITGVSGGREQSLYVWDMKSGTQVVSMKAPEGFAQMDLVDGRVWKINKDAGQLTEYGFKNGALDSIKKITLDLTPYGLKGKIEQMTIAAGGVVAIVPAKENNKWIFHNLRDQQKSIVFSGSRIHTQAEKDASAAAHAAYEKKLCEEGEQLARQYEGLSYMGPNGRTYILDWDCNYKSFVVGYFKHLEFFGPPGNSKKLPHNYIDIGRDYVTRDKLSDDGKRVCTSCHGTPIGSRTISTKGWTKRYVLGLVYYIKDEVVNHTTQYTLCSVCKGAGTVSK